MQTKVYRLHFLRKRTFLPVMISQFFFNCRLLCVEHVEKNGKPILYLVFEFLDTDLKKFIDSHRRGPSPRPIPPNVIKVSFLIFVAKFIKLGLFLLFLIYLNFICRVSCISCAKVWPTVIATVCFTGTILMFIIVRLYMLVNFLQTIGANSLYLQGN